MTVFLSLAVAPVHSDLVHGDEVLGAEPTLVLDLPVVDFVEVLQGQASIVVRLVVN